MTRHGGHVLADLVLSVVLCACLSGQSVEVRRTPASSPPAAGAAPVPPAATEPIAAPTEPAASTIPTITGVAWDPGNRLIRVGIDPWPASWSPWTMYVDGVEYPPEDENGGLSYRPNAPLEAPPDGLLIGTLPWASGLDRANFPCCGSMRFSVPDLGVTNTFGYNLVDQGCSTASAKACTSEWTVHDGDWVIDGSRSVTVEDAKIVQRGNIYIKDSATLTLRSSELRFERGSTPTIHVYFFVDPGARLVIDRSRVYPGPEDGGLVCVFNHGTTTITDSPTQIHYFDMSGKARLTIEHSELVNPLGGLLQVTGGRTKVTDSTLGALALAVPAGAHLEASGLASGATFEDWKVEDLIPEANYQLTLDRVTVLKDELTGELEHGPYERGWIFFLDPDSHVRLSDSELRKVFIELRNDTAEFRDLKIGEPSSLHYRDIDLRDVVLMGEWPFTVVDSRLTLHDSNYLFLQPSGNSTITLVDSHIVEFIPRDFTGTMIFENSSWTTAGEILGGVDYHSHGNRFTIKGSLKLDSSLRENLQWKDAQVTRVFEVLLTDAQGSPLGQGSIRARGREYPVDARGRASFSIVFDEANYDRPTTVEALVSGTVVDQLGVDFFTETPIRLTR